MDKVELKPAHMWRCPNCGEDNFCLGIIAELCDDEKEELKNAGYIGEALEIGFWMTFPKKVECWYCENVYGVSNQPDLDEFGENNDDIEYWK